MKFYKTEIWFKNGNKFEDYWVKGSDAESYFRPDKYNERGHDIERAEFWEMGSDADNFKIEELRCLGEWDESESLYYFDKNWETDNSNYKYDWSKEEAI